MNKFYLNLRSTAPYLLVCIFLVLLLPIKGVSQIDFIGDLRAQLDGNGPFRGTGTAMVSGGLKIQVEVFKTGVTGDQFMNNGSGIDCKLIVRQSSTGFDPDYAATNCTANPWLNATYTEETTGTNSFGGGGITMNFVGYNSNNDIYEYELLNVPPGRYTYECRCDDYTNNANSYLNSWDYDNCGDEDGDGLADGDLHYFTVGNEGIFRQIIIVQTQQGGNNTTEYYFDESLQPGNPSISEWDVITTQDSTLCQFFIGYELNTYKNISAAGDITGSSLVWSVTSKTANDVPETTSIIDFRDNCTDLLSEFSGGGSCQGETNGAGIGNGTDLIQDQRWQISPDNPAALSRYTNGFLDIKAAIEKVNAGDFPPGVYSFNFRADVYGSLDTIVGNNQSKTFEVVGVCTPLPVELLEFSGQKKFKEIVLNWATSTETNNAYFELERSADSRQFQTIATLDGAGNSTNYNAYQHIDEQPLSAINYYRLKQVDFDGQFTYSKIISVDMSRPIKLISGVYPNPVSDNVTILFETEEQDHFELDFRIFTISGKQVKSGTIQSNRPQIECSNLVKGTYLLELSRIIDGHLYQSTVKLVR